MPQTVAGREMYTSQETADILGVSLKTLCMYARSGRLRGTKWGRAWHFSKQAIQDFVGGETQPGWYLNGERLPEEQQRQIAKAAAEMLFGHGGH